MSDFCADCDGPIGLDNGPPDGWELEDGRVVCQDCCCSDLRQIAEIAAGLVDTHPAAPLRSESGGASAG